MAKNIYRLYKNKKGIIKNVTKGARFLGVD
jgi:hypothetical protein